MNREIKLRAWDNFKMWYPETKTSDNNDTFFAIYNNKEKTIGWGLYDMKLVYRIISGEYDAVLMQYTGLKDKNGKEIYEGDIIKYDNKEIYKIEWNYEICGWHPMIRLSNPYSDYFEILGNIYENPELL